MAPMGLPPHLKVKSPRLENKPLHWKAPYEEIPLMKKWLLESNPEKSETVINTCISLIKQHWKKVAEIPQIFDFLTWSIQTFVRKK